MLATEVQPTTATPRTKRRLLVYGNCQAGWLSRMLVRHADVEAQYEIVSAHRGRQADKFQGSPRRRGVMLCLAECSLKAGRQVVAAKAGKHRGRQILVCACESHRSREGFGGARVL